jgi:signal transduction histidine kinase
MAGGIIQKLKDWKERQERKPLPAAPLRDELFREILIAAAVALFAQGTLLRLGGVPWTGRGPRNLVFMTLMPAVWFVPTMLCHRAAAKTPRMAAGARAFLFVCIVEMVTLPTVAFPYAQFGAAVVLSIILAGLFISREYVMVWTSAVCVVQLSQMEYMNGNWNQYAGWCVVYLTAGWLVTLFAKNMESLFEANRVAEEQQRSAIVAERTRFARDIHDTLAQGLTGIMMQLNAAEQRLAGTPEARTYIEKARQLATDSLEEARRSVSALRAGALGNGSLLDAIAQIGNKLTSDSGVKLETKLEGQPYSLPEAFENNLLRIAQEALTNAVRHAHASSIFVFLAYRTGSVLLEIGDTGRGMSGGEPSGFGVDGMRERARQIGGEIKILSDPGRGTRIMVTVPNA